MIGNACKCFSQWYTNRLQIQRMFFSDLSVPRLSSSSAFPSTCQGAHNFQDAGQNKRGPWRHPTEFHTGLGCSYARFVGLQGCMSWHVWTSVQLEVSLDGPWNPLHLHIPSLFVSFLVTVPPQPLPCTPPGRAADKSRTVAEWLGSIFRSLVWGLAGFIVWSTTSLDTMRIYIEFLMNMNTTMNLWWKQRGGTHAAKTCLYFLSFGNKRLQGHWSLGFSSNKQ